jgi:hypothetical protein
LRDWRLYAPFALIRNHFEPLRGLLRSSAISGQQCRAAAPSQDSAPPAETKKPKKVWTNENLSSANGPVSVVGDPKNKPKPAFSKPANAQYVASVRKQLDKLQGDIADIDKQLVDLKHFSAGEPSTSASGIKLNKSYEREPIEVQMRALQDKKKDLESKVDALLDEARKKGIESSQLR